MGVESKEGVTAVVLVDSFSTCLHPLTLAAPLALLPLAGRTLLDLTLESLRLGGVTEVGMVDLEFPVHLVFGVPGYTWMTCYPLQVILYLTSHPAATRAWLAASRWSRAPLPLTITTIVNAECRCTSPSPTPLLLFSSTPPLPGRLPPAFLLPSALLNSSSGVSEMLVETWTPRVWSV